MSNTTITIKLETGNDSFRNGQDSIETMLMQVIQKHNNGRVQGKLMDINGNSVGTFNIEGGYEDVSEDDYDQLDEEPRSFFQEPYKLPCSPHPLDNGLH